MVCLPPLPYVFRLHFSVLRISLRPLLNGLNELICFVVVVVVIVFVVEIFFGGDSWLVRFAFLLL